MQVCCSCSVQKALVIPDLGVIYEGSGTTCLSDPVVPALFRGGSRDLEWLHFDGLKPRIVRPDAPLLVVRDGSGSSTEVFLAIDQSGDGFALDAKLQRHGLAALERLRAGVDDDDLGVRPLHAE